MPKVALDYSVCRECSMYDKWYDYFDWTFGNLRFIRELWRHADDYFLWWLGVSNAEMVFHCGVADNNSHIVSNHSKIPEKCPHFMQHLLKEVRHNGL